MEPLEKSEIVGGRGGYAHCGVWRCRRRHLRRHSVCPQFEEVTVANYALIEGATVVEVGSLEVAVQASIWSLRSGLQPGFTATSPAALPPQCEGAGAAGAGSIRRGGSVIDAGLIGAAQARCDYSGTHAHSVAGLINGSQSTCRPQHLSSEEAGGGQVLTTPRAKAASA